MVRDKELLVFRAVEQSFPNLYALPGTRKPVNDRHLYGHEMDCANVLVSLRLACGSSLVRWERQWDENDREAIGKPYNVWPDRTFELEESEQVFFLEVDRGTEDLTKQLWPKVQAYVRLSQAHPDQRFTVLFTAQGYRYHGSDLDRLNELIPVLGKPKRGNQFLVAVHDDFLDAPLGDVFVSPLNPSLKLSLLAL